MWWRVKREREGRRSGEMSELGIVGKDGNMNCGEKGCKGLE